MKLSLKKICKICVLLCVICLIGFQRIFDFFHFKDYASYYRIGFAFLGVILAFIVILCTKENARIRAYFKVASKYIVCYLPIIVFSMCYTSITFDYSIEETIYAITPYLYIFYCYPIIYVFYRDGQLYKFSRIISRIVLLILGIKTICWILYVFNGTELFPNLLFEYGSWSRDGTLRMDAGYLYGFAFAFYLGLAFKSRKLAKSKFALLFMLLFMIFITKFRFQIISLILTSLIVYCFCANTKIKLRNSLIILLFAFAVLIGSGFLDKIIGSFSTDSEYGGSTSTRILTIIHYWQQMIKQKAIFGLGLLNSANTNVYPIMHYINHWGTTIQYYLEDIGIIGAFFKFGILIIPLYGLLFYEAAKTCVMSFRTKARKYLFLIALVSYMIISCLALDIFDMQRALNVPFYLAVISYCRGENFSHSLNLNKIGTES